MTYCGDFCFSGFYLFTSGEGESEVLLIRLLQTCETVSLEVLFETGSLDTRSLKLYIRQKLFRILASTSSTIIIQMKTTTIQMETCVNTMMRNERMFSSLHIFLRVSFICSAFRLKSVSSWDYTQNYDLCSISFDVFGEIHNGLCSGFQIFT